MGEKSIKYRCEYKVCQDYIKKYGETYHRVYDLNSSDRFAICEGCGGILTKDGWKYTCDVCKKEVEPGKLVGLFVPHLCEDCDRKETEKNVRTGNVCLICGSPRNHCTC
jgi:hypothetical protein